MVVALFLAFFFFCTGFGLRIELGYDDLMNTTFAWEPPLSKLLIALAVPFTTFYRPTGSAVYRLMFELFGLTALPFRILAYSLLLLNLLLIYKLVARVSRDREVAAMSVLLCCYHGRLAGIYLNNGTLYDVLCGTFMLSAMLFYVTRRDGEKIFRIRDWVIFAALFILAINAKEMAAVLPAILLCYEALFHLKRSPPPQNRRLLFGQLAPLGLCCLIALGAGLCKTANGSVMGANPEYALTFSAARFLEHWRHLLSDLFYVRGDGLSTPVAAVLLCLPAFLASAARRRDLGFFAAIALLGPLPVILIPYRGFFVMYVPLVGWAVLLAFVLVEGRNRILRSVSRKRNPEISPFGPERVLLFLSTAVLILTVSSCDPGSLRVPADPGQIVISRTRDDILAVDEPLPIDACVLFLHDRFPPNAYGTGMILRLLYNDRTLTADRPTMMSRPPDELRYDRVFDYVDDRLQVVRRLRIPNDRRPQYYPE